MAKNHGLDFGILIVVGFGYSIRFGFGSGLGRVGGAFEIVDRVGILKSFLHLFLAEKLDPLWMQWGIGQRVCGRMLFRVFGSKR